MKIPLSYLYLPEKGSDPQDLGMATSAWSEHEMHSYSSTEGQFLNSETEHLFMRLLLCTHAQRNGSRGIDTTPLPCS